MASGLLSSFVAAIQASLSVLLVISYGGVAAHFGLLDNKNGKAISKICVKMFLPALLLVKLGSEMHPSSAHRYLIILLWAFITHFVSFLIGIAAHLFLGMPDWITCALMFNNTTSYPLLLIQSLDETGILRGLGGKDESTRDMIERAKSYFLVFSTVSSCLTFTVGPRLIDSEHACDSEDEDRASMNDGTTVAQNDGFRDNEDAAGGNGNSTDSIADERTRLLASGASNRYASRHHSVTAITFFPSKPKFTTVRRRPYYITLPKWGSFNARTKWWLLFFYDFLNAPLIGAVLGAIIGLATPLHTAFFSPTFDGGVFTAWLTESWKNVGQLFVPLPLIVAGISLYTSYIESRKPSPFDSRVTRTTLLTTSLILIVRFIVWPVLSIAAIYLFIKGGKNGVLGEDPVLWFAMMIMPTGPPAMKLITMIQVSDAGEQDERSIAKILMISYVVSPVLAFTVVGALKVCQGVHE